MNDSKPRGGSLLISEPFMMDPNFQRSVILLCEHDSELGSLGLVLNQPAPFTIKDFVSELSDLPDEFDFPIFFGGPVERDVLQFTHRLPELIPEGRDLGNGQYWGGNFESVLSLLLSRSLKTTDIKFFIGYSGWDSGQLEQELDENSWVVLNNYHPDIILMNDPENLWREAIIAMGPKYAHVANFPINPMWN